MTETPLPPDYAPSVGLPTTWWTVTEQQPEAEQEPEPSRWSFAWARPRYNAVCCGFALLPLGYWRDALHACATQQSPSAAVGLSVMALALTALADRWRRSWHWRTALWLAVLGLATTPTVLLGALTYLTGAVT